MPVPNNMADLSSIASSNSPSGTEAIGNGLDNYLRAAFAIIKSTNSVASSTIASASTTDISSADGQFVQVTGTANINSFGTGFPGCIREVRFTGACTLTNSGSIILPDAANVTTVAGQVIAFRCLSSGVWQAVYGSRDTGAVRKAGDLMSGQLSIATASDQIALFSGSFSRNIGVNASGVTSIVDNQNASYAWQYSPGAGGVHLFRGSIAATGNVASVGFDARDGGASWIWYATGNATRLFQIGSGEKMSVDGAGSIIHPGNLTTGGSFALTGNMTAGGNITATGNVTGGSDERVKTNWRPLPSDFLERLVRVKHGIYDRTDIHQTQAGVGAQSLRGVLGELVEEAEDGFLSVVYGNAGLLGAIVAGERLLALESRVKELEGG